MFPNEWSYGEMAAPKYTFKDFQEFPDLCKEGAALFVQSQDERMAANFVIENFSATDANHGIGDMLYGMTLIATDDQLRSMLLCWLRHDRDMLRAKLAWSE